MRIITAPIFITADGDGVCRGYGHGSMMPLIVLDANKLNVGSVRQALKYDTPDLLEKCCSYYGKAMMEVPLLSDLFSERGKEKYKKNVLPHIGEDDFDVHIKTYFTDVVEKIKKDPDKLVTAVKKANLQNYPKAAQHRARIEKVIGLLPDTLATVMKNEDLTIIVSPKISRVEGSGNYLELNESREASYIPLNHRIGVNSSFLDRTSDAGMCVALKEELMHHLDMSHGVSSSAAFQAEAKKILINNQKLSAIDTMADEAFAASGIPHNTKPSLGQYPEQIARMELFANYFHIRDYLQQQGADGERGFAAAHSASKVRPEVDAKMRELFGNTIADICTQFEELLAQEAQVKTVAARIK